MGLAYSGQKLGPYIVNQIGGGGGGSGQPFRTGKNIKICAFCPYPFILTWWEQQQFSHFGTKFRNLLPRSIRKFPQGLSIACRQWPPQGKHYTRKRFAFKVKIARALFLLGGVPHRFDQITKEKIVEFLKTFWKLAKSYFACTNWQILFFATRCEKL